VCQANAEKLCKSVKLRHDFSILASGYSVQIAAPETETRVSGSSGGILVKRQRRALALAVAGLFVLIAIGYGIRFFLQIKSFVTGAVPELHDHTVDGYG
jgi:hypothetical protein